MATKKTKVIQATGRRKTSSASVNLTPVEGSGEGENAAKIVINKRALEEYFPLETSRQILSQPLELCERQGVYDIRVRVAGGGTSGQAGAVLHGLARALEKAEPDLRPQLKKAGFLTRDSRAVERKKPGRHKARKGTQFSKR